MDVEEGERKSRLWLTDTDLNRENWSLSARPLIPTTYKQLYGASTFSELKSFNIVRPHRPRCSSARSSRRLSLSLSNVLSWVCSKGRQNNTETTFLSLNTKPAELGCLMFSKNAYLRNYLVLMSRSK